MLFASQAYEYLRANINKKILLAKSLVIAQKPLSWMKQQDTNGEPLCVYLSWTAAETRQTMCQTELFNYEQQERLLAAEFAGT